MNASDAPGASAVPRRVLVVEDDPDCRTALRLYLQTFGHGVEAVGDGLQAVRKGLAWRPDIALIDLDIPLLDGCEVARGLRALLGEGLLLVALTGRSRPEDRARALGAGFDCYLLKPVEPASLLRAIQRAWALGAQTQELVRQNAELAGHLGEAVEGLRQRRREAKGPRPFLR
jgi:CheY-like chemotaxis protein